MKLIVLYKKPLEGNSRLLPRDIRNYIASILKDSDQKDEKEAHEVIMAHQNVQPTFIFSMPNRKSFCIYSFKKDPKTKRMMNAIKECIQKNQTLKINNVNAEVKEVFIARAEYTRFESGLFERRLRTPLVIAAAEFEYAICRKFSEEGKVDMAKLKKYTEKKIKETIGLMARDWFDTEEEVLELMEDTTIMFKDLEYTPIPYKKGEYYPAVKGTIISDRNLPLFIGYKSGLGYGELSSLKEMDRRRGK